MNGWHGGVALLLILALTGCTPAVTATTTEPVTMTAEVVAIVDGDTIDVATGEGIVRVRLIGIDTPEIGRGGEASECYAVEARTFLDELLYGQEVQLIGDPTQADADRYGRLLRAVYVDGQSAAELAITAGTGHEYTFDRPYAGQDTHRSAEKFAAGERIGLWSHC